MDIVRYNAPTASEICIESLDSETFELKRKERHLLLPSSTFEMSEIFLKNIFWPHVWSFKLFTQNKTSILIYQKYNLQYFLQRRLTDIEHSSCDKHDSLFSWVDRLLSVQIDFCLNIRINPQADKIDA